MTKSKREKFYISFYAYIVDEGYPDYPHDDEKEISGVVYAETYEEAQKKIGKLVDRERKKRGMPPNGMEIVLLSEEVYSADEMFEDYAVLDKEGWAQIWEGI